ncbi:MAG: hypothetical protein ISS74_02425 [Planctomycetes bacterium]|nr:hypothetical protein [Planctomycetota bacterium]
MPDRRRPLAAIVAATVAVALAVAFSATAMAGGGPENVFLVVNEDSWASMAVANEYAHLRGVPPGHIMYLADLPGFEQMGVDAFRAKILEPVLQAIQDRGLANQIDYVIYSSDLPWGIDVGSDVGDRELPKFITKRASINGLTYLYDLVLQKDIQYLSLASNAYYRQPKRRVPQREWTPEEQAEVVRAYEHIREGRWAEAEKVLRPLAEKHPGTAEVHYNLACCLARLDRPEQAVTALEKAIQAGWADADHTRQDADLAPLRDREDFKRLLDRMAKPVFDVEPATAFRSTYAWSPTGRRTEPHQGRRYMLSMMLAVTSGRGNSLDEVRGYLRRSASADGTAPNGTVYLMKNGDIRSRTREWAFAATVAKLQDLGIRAEIRDGVLPKNKPDVAGLVVGSASFDWKTSGSTILPGAICEHLTSSGAVMLAHAGQTPISEFLRYGAAASSGTVIEPMAIQAKFPSPLMQVHYASGASVAEAFYQSILGPYQLLIVGDPLCRPWAKIPQVTVEGLRPGQTVKGTLHLKPGVANLKANQIDHYELLLWGGLLHQCRPGETIEVDTTTLSDGYHDLRLVAVASDALATRGRLLLPVTVNNAGQALAVTGPAEKTVAWGEPLRLSASLEGAQEIRFLHNARILATIEGARGEVEIDTRRLGLGPVRILPVACLPPEGKVKPSDFAKASRPAALTGGKVHPGTCVAATPVEVEIVGPAALPATEAPPEKDRHKGLRLKVDGAEAVRIESARDTNWLQAAGARNGKTFDLQGYVEVKTQGLYQVQVRAGAEVALEMDGRRLEAPPSDRWGFIPVHLAAGWHRFRASGTAGQPPRLDVRFGLSGTREVGAEQFVCNGPFAEKKAGE